MDGESYGLYISGVGIVVAIVAPIVSGCNSRRRSRKEMKSSLMNPLRELKKRAREHCKIGIELLTWRHHDDFLHENDDGTAAHYEYICRHREEGEEVRERYSQTASLLDDASERYTEQFKICELKGMKFDSVLEPQRIKTRILDVISALHDMPILEASACETSSDILEILVSWKDIHEALGLKNSEKI